MAIKIQQTSVAPSSTSIAQAPNALGFTVLPFASELLKQSFALRYQVYCEELNFLNKQDYPSGEESDEFDAGSVHVGALNVNQEVIASARMVPSTRGLFPMENHVAIDDSATRENLKISLEELRNSSAVEVSRLVVDPGYRRRRGDTRYALAPGHDRRNPERAEAGRRSSPAGPTIALGIYKTLFQTSQLLGIRYWMAAMEPVLISSLARYGMKFVPIGPVADYYGPVQPCALDVNTILATMQASCPERGEDWAEAAPQLWNKLISSHTLH